MGKLCAHRRYISLDADRLERAAGRLEICGKAAQDVFEQGVYEGAAQALRILHEREVEDDDDMRVLLEMRALGTYTNGTNGRK